MWVIITHTVGSWTQIHYYPGLQPRAWSDLLTWASARVDRSEVLFWRTTKGAEVDFVIETGRRLLPVEVKAAASAHPWDVRYLHTFLDEYSDMAQCGILLYDGEETFWLTDRVLAAPWWRVL